MSGRPFPPLVAAGPIALWLSLSVGCAGTQPVPVAPVEPVPSAAQDPAPSEPQDDERAATARQAQEVRRHSLEILAEVSGARALSVSREMQVDIISRKGIREFARETMYEHIRPEQFHLLARIESSFGVLPDGANGEKILLDLLETGVLGLYDPKRKTLFVGDFVPKAMLSQVVGHEIVHGLQDMHFDLEALQKPLFHESDADTARTYLVEGDAQAAYFSWVSGSDGLAAISDEVLDAMGRQTLDLADLLPYPILARQLQLPYTMGAATVARLARREGWKAVDALYAELPASTEQMLHVEKLLAREAPVPVTIDVQPLSAALPGLERVWDDTLGEAALLSMLADVEPSSRARQHADGWGGGRYVVFDDPDAPLPTPVVAGAVAWDTRNDATEFSRAFQAYLENRASTPATSRPGAPPEPRGSSAGRFAVEQRGKVVYFALRMPPDLDPNRVMQALRRAVTVGKAGKK